MSNVANADETLANASIEQITEMALKNAGTDQPGAAVEIKQDVVAAPSGQTTEQTAAAKESDKELNFAKLRTKTESLERETQALREENERLAKRGYVSELPADHAQKVAEVDAKSTDLWKQFQDGDLTGDEYQIKLREMNAERDRLVASVVKYEISSEMKAQRESEAAELVAAEEAKAKLSWQETVTGFISSKPDAIDYSTDEAKSRDLDTYVKALAADPDNTGRPQEWYLQEAHVLVKHKHGIATTSTAPASGEKPAPVTKHTLPFHTLSDVPGGVPPAKSEIEQLEQVSGAALTNRFANMSSAEIDKQLATLS